MIDQAEHGQAAACYRLDQPTHSICVSEGAARYEHGPIVALAAGPKVTDCPTKPSGSPEFFCG
jgi:hypothetical protein